MDGESTESQKKHIQVAIVSKDKVKTHITPDFQRKFNNVWMDKLMDMIHHNEELPVAQYASQSHPCYNGAVLINCENELSAEMMRKVYAGKIINGVELDVIDASNVPKPVKMAWKCRSHHRKNYEAALEELQKAYPALRTYEWRYLQFNEEIPYIRWVVHMAPDSAKIIKEAGYQLSYKPSEGKVIVDTFKRMKEVSRYADQSGLSGEEQNEAEGDEGVSSDSDDYIKQLRKADERPGKIKKNMSRKIKERKEKSKGANKRKSKDFVFELENL